MSSFLRKLIGGCAWSRSGDPRAARIVWQILLGAIVVTSALAAEEDRVADVTGWSPRYSEVLQRAGVVPVRTLSLSGAMFHLSKPFALDDSRQIAVAWVAVSEEKSIRVLYRSNSQCCWRLCDAMTPNHIGKGFHEFDKQIPVDITIDLLRRSRDVGQLRPWFPVDAEISGEDLARRLMHVLTVDRDSGLKSGEVLWFGPNYVTREYASLIPAVPRPFSIVTGHIALSTGGKVPDPDATRLPPAEELPIYEQEIESVEFFIPSYATFGQSDGRLTGRVYLSHDQRVKYFFVEDSKQRVMLACVEMVLAPICLVGLRTQYFDVMGMDIPLLEYGVQIPDAFGGRRKARYQLNWNWVRRLPIIEHYYRGTGRTMPPPIDDG